MKPMKPHEYLNLVIEHGAGDYNGDRWIYAGTDQEVACVPEEAIGGPDAWAKFFRASPAIAQHLISLLVDGHHANCSNRNRNPNACTTECRAIYDTLTDAGVPLP